MLRGLFRVLLGFTLAVLTAGAVQVLFALPPVDLVRLPLEEALSRLGTLGLLSLAVATHAAIFSVVFGLVAIALAELTGVRSAGYYLISGLAIALAGFLAQFTSETISGPTIVNTYALLAFSVTGLIGGLVYWLVAGRRAGRKQRPERKRIVVEPEEADARKTIAGTSTFDAAAAATSVPTTRAAVNRKPLEVA